MSKVIKNDIIMNSFHVGNAEVKQKVRRQGFAVVKLVCLGICDGIAECRR